MCSTMETIYNIYIYRSTITINCRIVDGDAGDMYIYVYIYIYLFIHIGT